MRKENSKELCRVKNNMFGRYFLGILRASLNRAKYQIRVRGRKPDKVKMMERGGLPANYFSRDGDIPRKYATELAVYIDGLANPCEGCDHKETTTNLLRRTQWENDLLAKIKHGRGVIIESLREEVTKKDEEIKCLHREEGQRVQTISYLAKVVDKIRWDKKALQERLDTTKLRAENWARQWYDTDWRAREDRDIMRSLRAALDRATVKAIKYERALEIMRVQKELVAMLYYFGWYKK